jgi:probable rRNA maturation factor
LRKFVAYDPKKEFDVDLPFLINFIPVYNISAWDKFEAVLNDFLKALYPLLGKHITFKHKEKSHLSVVFSNDDEVKNLNSLYRHMNKHTNVLSFPDVFLDELAYLKPEQDPHLGDVILAYETIERESREQEKNLMDHIKHLVLHGILHILGYDHIKDEEAEEMESLEIDILKDLNIKNPYD